MAGLLGKFGNFINKAGSNMGQLQGNPMFNMGVGLLAAGGNRQGPKVSFGQGLAEAQQYANGQQNQFQQLQSQRQALQQQKAQQNAIKGIQGLLSAPPLANVPVAIRAPNAVQNQQNQLTGLLAQANPQAFTQSLINQQFAQPQTQRATADLNTFSRLYPELQQGTEDYRTKYLEFVQQKDATGNLEQQARLGLLVEQLNAARSEREKGAETDAKARTSMFRGVSTDLNKIKQLSEINSRLQGSVLETGKPLPELTRAAVGGVQAIQDLLGIDSDKAAKIKSDFDTFNKLSSDFLIGSLDRFNESGTVTNVKFNELIKSNAGIGSSPETNNFIFASNIKAILDAAKIEGIEIPDADVYRELAKQLQGNTVSTPTPTVEPRVIDFNELP